MPHAWPYLQATCVFIPCNLLPHATQSRRLTPNLPLQKMAADLGSRPTELSPRLTLLELNQPGRVGNCTFTKSPQTHRRTLPYSQVAENSVQQTTGDAQRIAPPPTSPAIATHEQQSHIHGAIDRQNESESSTRQCGDVCYRRARRRRVCWSVVS